MSANLSTQRDAELLAADAMGWLRAIRDANSAASLASISKQVLGQLNARHACFAIRQHFAGAIREETDRHTRPVSRKSLASGEREE